MRVVVCVKQVAAIADEVELSADSLDVEPATLELALNEWDAYAVEAALRLREAAGKGSEVVAVSVGPEAAEAALRRALALGADRAVRVAAATPAADPFVVAHALAAAVLSEAPDLVLAGAQSGDAVQGATGSVLAELLGLPCVAVVTAIEPAPDGRSAVVRRGLEGGLTEVLGVELPAVVTVQTGAARPRHPTLRTIKQAERQEILVVEPEHGAEAAYRVRRLLVPPPAAGAELLGGDAGAIAARIAELVREGVS